MADAVISEIASAIQVRHIQTPLGKAKPFTRASVAGDVLAHMDRNQFDVSPVFPDGADFLDGAPRDPDGLLSKTPLEQLDGSVAVRDVVRPLASSALIDCNASLRHVLGRFREEHTFMLTVGHRGLEGIVTPSDMNKQAGRTHLFMQVSALELGLSDLIRAANLSDEALYRILPGGRATRARGRYKRKMKKDETADLVAALDFQDILHIEKEIGRIESFSSLEDKTISDLADFRNKVMHAVLEPAGDDAERVGVLLSQTGLITSLLDAIETDTSTPMN